jgi:hypothetical protein
MQFSYVPPHAPVGDQRLAVNREYTRAPDAIKKCRMSNISGNETSPFNRLLAHYV